jgi:organic hydroperoxide reductase OsmC/OhrA
MPKAIRGPGKEGTRNPGQFFATGYAAFLEKVRNLADQP